MDFSARFDKLQEKEGTAYCSIAIPAGRSSRFGTSGGRRLRGAIAEISTGVNVGRAAVGNLVHFHTLEWHTHKWLPRKAWRWTCARAEQMEIVPSNFSTRKEVVAVVPVKITRGILGMLEVLQLEQKHDESLCELLNRCLATPTETRKWRKPPVQDWKGMLCGECKGTGQCRECNGTGACGTEDINVIKLETSKKPDGSVASQHVTYKRTYPKQCPKCGGAKPLFRSGGSGSTASPFTSNDFGPVTPAIGKGGDGQCRHCNGRGKVLSYFASMAPARQRGTRPERPASTLLPESAVALMPILTGGIGGFQLPEARPLPPALVPL